MGKVHAFGRKKKPVLDLLAFVGIVLGCVAGISGISSAEQDPATSSAAGDKNPIPYERQSVSAGRTLFIQNCSSCHGTNGKAQVGAVASATDLTTPKFFNYGSADNNISAAIKNGVGNGMPPFNDELSETDIWKIVNFVKSLWKESPPPT
tara:strand:+ start:9703 stop:10152 length:450 start_codon:yes stop_codon:yes gene_type:complete